MTGPDWHDPFAKDEEALERERRRAEREARRRERRKSLGEKVGQAGAPTATAEPSAPPPSADGDGRGPSRPALRPLRSADRSGPEAATLRNRRIVAGGLLLAVVALCVFGAVRLIGALGDDEPAPAPAASPVPKTDDLLIVEGLTRDQIADEVGDRVKGDYLRASDSPPKDFKLKKYGAADAPNLEGFLFPATYPVTKSETARELVRAQLDAFRDNLAQVDLSYAKSKNLNVYDVLKIASMIEREIQVPEERKLAAAVIYNRLAADDTLGIDATIRYEDRNYDEQLTESRLAEPTPYNTRINPGLPPTPIGNPGLASIKAAANPAKSDAYYFVVKPGTCGEHVFVKTEAEFARAEDAYQEALQAQGNSPTEC